MRTKKSVSNRILWMFGVIGALIFAAEVGLRLVGVTDFPTYQTDDVIGYIPAPNQSGAFLNKNRYQINERSMGSGPWKPEGQRDLLLLGDSLVWGGNPLDQPEKLGPLLQAAAGNQWRVWSASAGSWSVLNELAYLDRYPDVQSETDLLVWVLNTGDLAATPSQWSNEETHPRSRPQSALLYALGKYVAPRLGFDAGAPSAQGTPTISAETAGLLKSRLSQLTAHSSQLTAHSSQLTAHSSQLTANKRTSEQANKRTSEQANKRTSEQANFDRAVSRQDRA